MAASTHTHTHTCPPPRGARRHHTRYSSAGKQCHAELLRAYVWSTSCLTTSRMGEGLCRGGKPCPLSTRAPRGAAVPCAMGRWMQISFISFCTCPQAFLLTCLAVHKDMWLPNAMPAEAIALEHREAIRRLSPLLYYHTMVHPIPHIPLYITNPQFTTG